MSPETEDFIIYTVEQGYRLTNLAWQILWMQSSGKRDYGWLTASA